MSYDWTFKQTNKHQNREYYFVNEDIILQLQSTNDREFAKLYCTRKIRYITKIKIKELVARHKL